jgi:hypothetical protein
MIDEIKANVQNGIWQLAIPSVDKKIISLKWVYKIKWIVKGKFEKYKIRIMIKGFSQIIDLDFEETFAPVVRMESIRFIFAISTIYHGKYIFGVQLRISPVTISR